MKLKDKVAVVTGGRQGIGRGIVEAFLVEGAGVIACGRAGRPQDMPPAVKWATLDVSNATMVNEFAKSVGEIDILVNNAGVQIEKTVPDSTDADWDLVVGTNARGVFNLCRVFIPLMRESGAIINIGSISGMVSDPTMALYNAPKAFVDGLTRSIAVDHGPGIRCNAICPGWIETGMLEAGFALAGDGDAARADALARHASGRFGTPADIAAMAVWLASDESTFATGQCFTVDGGLTAATPVRPGLF